MELLAEKTNFVYIDCTTKNVAVSAIMDVA